MLRAIEDSLRFLRISEKVIAEHRGKEVQKFFFETRPEIIKIALTSEDITKYNLPPDFTKKTDTRAKKFIEQHGDIAVELDALPLPILQQKIRESIEENIDLEAFDEVRKIEDQEKQGLSNLIL